MGHFTSVRGWLQIDRDMVDEVRSRIASFVQRASDYALSTDEAEFYVRGWVFQQEELNWSRYVFYGEDIRTYNVRFVEDLVRELGEQVSREVGGYTNRPRGVFHLDDEDEERTTVWVIGDGKFAMRETDFLFDRQE